MRQYGFRFDGDDVGDQTSTGLQAVEAGVEQPGLGQAAADEDRGWRWDTVECVGRFVADVDIDARGGGIGPMLRRRCSSRSNATAVQPRQLRHHSTAMLPEPAPTSHSRSPGRGCSAAKVTARIPSLVI